MKKITQLLSATSLTLLALTSPLSAAAQACVPTPGGIPCPNQTILGSGIGGVRDLIGLIANWMFVFLLVIAVLYIIMAAYKYLFSGGSEEGVSAAHNMLIYAVVAIAVAFLAKGIVFVVQQLVGGGSGSGFNSGGFNGGGGSGVQVGGYYDSNGNWHVNVGFGGGN
jgi:hypothetical protein